MVDQKKSRKETRRERSRKRRQQERLKSRLTNGVVIIAVVAFVGLIIFNLTRPGVGEEQEIMEESIHVNDNETVEYNTNPPSSGPHYANPMPAGFYHLDSPEATQLLNPHSYVVHSLEHGYVALWYNCNDLDDAACDQLVDDIQNVLADLSSEVVAFPFPNMDYNVAMTSWGMLTEMPDGFDADLAREFITANRNSQRSPEPEVP